VGARNEEVVDLLLERYWRDEVCVAGKLEVAGQGINDVVP
jgi:hypothetical protein